MIIVAGCNSDDKKNSSDGNTTDTVVSKSAPSISIDSQLLKPGITATNKVYTNDRFKNVTLEKQAPGKFLVKGKARVFEATFSWVVEDGHNEIVSGHEMTDAGAPAWGNFSFMVAVVKSRPNSTLHLILFEASAKDGSRQSELPIILE